MVPTKATTPTRKDASSQIVAVDHEVAGEAAAGDVAFVCRQGRPPLVVTEGIVAEDVGVEDGC